MKMTLFYRRFSTDEVNARLYDAEPCASTEEAAKWIDFYPEEEPRDHHRRILILKESGEKIGTCGFHCRNREKGTAETGRDLQPVFWRRGYMTEALQAILLFARKEMKVRRVFAHISIDNPASVKTAGKAGFVKSGETFYEKYRGEKYLHDIYVPDTEP